MISAITYLITCGTLLTACMLCLLSLRNDNVQANRWLGVFFFGFSLSVADNALAASGWQIATAMQAMLEVPRLAIAPALFLAVVAFTTPQYAATRRDLLHFVPLAVFNIIILLALLDLLPTRMFTPVQTRIIGIVVMVLVKLQAIIYWLLAYIRLRRYQRRTPLYASNLAAVDLAWLQYFLLALVVAIAFWIDAWLFRIPWISAVAPFGYLAVAFFITFFAVNQRELYPYTADQRTAIQGLTTPTQSPAASTVRLSADELEKGKVRLAALMEQKKLFLDPDLSLPRLAEEALLSTHELSYLLNTGFGENFYTFVNRYRVEEAKRLLGTRLDTLSMLGIAYESGFRSKTTFNNTFRKHTGMSPTQFTERYFPKVRTSPPPGH